MKKFLLFAIVAVLVPFMLSAQYSLRGSVTDKQSERLLAGATVSAGDYSVQTDDNGQFLISGLPAGPYTVRVSYLGYGRFSGAVNLQSDKIMNVSLERQHILTDEVTVMATRASENSATTYKNISRQDLEKNNQGQDLPYLLNHTPSVVVNSDAGAGIGYTGIRIRGSDATRINVTLNGIPLNNPESQGSFFVNLPDFASSADNIQIQRGVGTSTNGAGAFGGSLNIQTTTRRDSAYAELNNTYGSFDTWKNTVNIGTGLINDKFSFDGRLSRIKSDGYIDRASSDLKSYFLTGAFYGKKDLVRVNVFSGAEKTYQAWDGVPQELLETNRTYNGFTYPDQTDNYTQDHYQLLYSHTFNPALSFNTALHYTYGRGYYEEYKEDDDLKKYGISPINIGDTVINTSDIIRRRWLDNHFYGLTYSLNYRPSALINLTLGGAYNEYDGDHFGEVIRSQYAASNTIGNPNRYYQGNGFKTDFNVYGKADVQLGDFYLYGDLQYRRVSYTIDGTDKNLRELGVSDKLNFFNPKLGFTYTIDNRSNVYASFAVANKEPNRDDYINTETSQLPKSENLKDIEAGYRLRTGNLRAGINGFWMIYKDQLVLTGKINDVGEALRQNVPNSYRLGLELDSYWKITPRLSWAASASLSRNKIKEFTEFIEDWDNYSQQYSATHRNTTIAYSPSFIGSSELSYQFLKKAEVAFLTKYVSRQYLDNTSNSSNELDHSSNRARVLDAFLVNDLRLRYNAQIKPLKNIGFTVLVNNIFGELYENNGYTYRYITDGELYTSNYYFPQATRNFLLSVNMRF